MQRTSEIVPILGVSQRTAAFSRSIGDPDRPINAETKTAGSTTRRITQGPDARGASPRAHHTPSVRLRSRRERPRPRLVDRAPEQERVQITLHDGGVLQLLAALADLHASLRDHLDRPVQALVARSA
jgi:hypothetical protein